MFRTSPYIAIRTEYEYEYGYEYEYRTANDTVVYILNLHTNQPHTNFCMYEFTYKWPLHTFLHTNCIMPKLCSFMLNYASYANIMPIMLYAPAMLLCQFLCWHNPLTPSSSSRWCRGKRLVAGALRTGGQSPGSNDLRWPPRQAATCVQQQRSSGYPGYPPSAVLSCANQANIRDGTPAYWYR